VPTRVFVGSGSSGGPSQLRYHPQDGAIRGIDDHQEPAAAGVLRVAEQDLSLRPVDLHLGVAQGRATEFGRFRPRDGDEFGIRHESSLVVVGYGLFPDQCRSTDPWPVPG
jgi:hypothetical protein